MKIVNQYSPCYSFSMFTLDSLKEYLLQKGINRFFFKKLAENDNSKNQIYLGGSFDVIQDIPFGDIVVEQGLKKPVYKAPLNFWWIGENGNIEPAKGAQLVMYPKYPEVRLSGFLKGCRTAPSEYFQPVPKSERTGMYNGRILILAPTNDKILAYLAIPNSQLSSELLSLLNGDTLGVVETGKGNIRDELISLLYKAWMENPHELVRMYPDGSIKPYTNKNAGGYTLEAFFGIKPNGQPFPDYKGWELKSISGNVATLMTPQPDGGLYSELGNDMFVRQFGHLAPDGRMYFTGKYTSRKMNSDRIIVINGFDVSSGKITKEDGYVGLFQKDILLASWSFPHLIGHWNTKHNQACYVKYTKIPQTNLLNYKPEVLLCEGTSAMMFLESLSYGRVYLDPACREAKARNQFRTTFNDLFSLYSVSERLDLSSLDK